MQRVSLFGIIAMMAVALTTIAATSAGLPDPVATQFGGGGRAHGWMTRDGYVVFMAAMTVGLPLVLWVSMAWLPRVAPRLVNIPHRDYWLAAPERASALGALAGFGAGFAALTSAFLCALHLLIVAANESTPPVLPQAGFLWLMGLFGGGITLLLAALIWRFRRLPGRR
jgi:hypothetical protein